MKAYIKQVESISPTQCAVIAQIVHARGEVINDNFGAAVSESCNREMAPVAGSTIVINAGSGATSTFVRTILTRTQDVLPADAREGMSSISANMYMDKTERLWTMRHSESGDVLVRTSDVDDNAALIEMIHSCSSNLEATTLRNYAPEVAQAVDSIELYLAGARGGDMVQYVSASGVAKTGFVVAQYQDLDQHGFVVLGSGETQEEVISSKSMVSRLDADQLDEKQFPALDSVSAAGGIDVEKLVNYYARVFSYSPEYFAKVEGIIRNYSF